MNNFDVLLEFPLAVHAAVFCFAACATTVLALVIAAPRRNCFFFRWEPEVRFLALVVSPTMLILWPLLLYRWFLKSRGIGPDDLDFFDDD